MRIMTLYQSCSNLRDVCTTDWDVNLDGMDFFFKVRNTIAMISSYFKLYLSDQERTNCVDRGHVSNPRCDGSSTILHL